MTTAEEITHLKTQLAKRDEAIRELNERASSHLRASQNTIQALKLELDMANAKLRERQRVLPDPPHDPLKTFFDCIGVPIGIGKITAPQKL